MQPRRTAEFVGKKKTTAFDILSVYGAMACSIMY